MTVFALVAVLLTAATLVVVLRPLLRASPGSRASADELNAAVYREQLAELDAQLAEGALDAAHHAQAREGVRRRLAQDLRPGSGAVRQALAQRGTAVAVGIGISTMAAALYVALGTPAALAPAAPAIAPPRDAAHGLQGAQILGMVERLAQRLRDNPEDLNGWVMLARSYSALGRFDEASRAYGEAAKRSPADANLLADYADVLAMAQGRSFDGEPDRLIARALDADRNHIKALALAGSAAFARKRYARAIEFWERIREQVPADTDTGRSIEASIQQARALAGGNVPAASGAAPAAASAARVSGRVVISPEMASRVQPGDTLFIYARATSGSRVPLAILRAPVGRWPVAFALDDSLAMSPAAKLSSHAEVTLEARVSRSGTAAAAAGDLRGTLTPVRVGAAGAVIEITSIVE